MEKVFTYKSNVVGTVKVLGQLYSYGDKITVLESEKPQLTQLLKTQQIIETYD